MELISRTVCRFGGLGACPEYFVKSRVLRHSLDCHFAAQSVIGLCNAWGDIIVRDPELDLFDIIQKCTDLLLNGFREKRRTERSTK